MIPEIIPGIVLICIMFIGIVYSIIKENKTWNKGICSECKNGTYQSKDTDSSGATLYCCNNCENSFWANNWFKSKKIIDNIKPVIRNKKLVKIK